MASVIEAAEAIGTKAPPARSMAASVATYRRASRAKKAIGTPRLVCHSACMPEVDTFGICSMAEAEQATQP